MKTFLIAKREFLNIVMKKTFLLTTLLVPISIFLIQISIGYFAATSSSKLMNIAVIDNAKVFENSLKNDDNNFSFQFLQLQNQAEANELLKQKKLSAYIWIPQDFNIKTDSTSFNFVSNETISFKQQLELKSIIRNNLKEKKLIAYTGFNTAEIEALKNLPTLVFENTQGTKQHASKSFLVYGIGMFFGFLVYITLFLYGTMVFRGVIEEKTNRIVEVMISAVRPFQLMMGKILGIGGVGLAQFSIWIVLIFIIQFIVGGMFSGTSVDTKTAEEAANSGLQVLQQLKQLNWGLLVFCFLFYFLGAYFLYASLFAAVGSAVNESPQDAQSLMLPITLPIIISFVILINTLENPHSNMAVFASIFPLTSPIVMMGRIAYGVPEGVSWGELILSMAVLVISFILIVKLAARIYSVGILMYGKKPSLKNIIQWGFKRR